jgi:hypothetical protein
VSGNRRRLAPIPPHVRTENSIRFRCNFSGEGRGNSAKLHSWLSQAQMRSIQLRFFSNQSKSLMKNPTGFRLRSQRLPDCELIFRKPNRSGVSNNLLSNGILRG